MKTLFSEEDISRLIAASKKSVFRTYVEAAVTEHFRSMHYLSSMLICDCVVLNLVINDNITPRSADKIITCIRRDHRSLYTTVDSAFTPIENSFDEYARRILGNDYADIEKLYMRKTNYIVYVISRDVKENCNADSNEIYLSDYSYKEREECCRRQ